MEIMKKADAKRLKELLENTLTESGKMFEDTEVDKAYIVGYLEGAVKCAIAELND